jgi:transcriptional regulator with XRE-family HTH domain
MGVMTEDDPRVVFGREIRRRRDALGLTLDQFAERCGLSSNYIGTIENGHRDPALSTIEALARGLGIPTGELLGPVPKLSAAAIEMATLFEQIASADQAAILDILRAVTSTRR